ncbi:for, partial [Symbiodinium sp. CCMP2456]
DLDDDEFERRSYPASVVETEPAVEFGDALESSSEVEELEQPAMLERRGGVSALPTGAFNVRFANWSSPYFEKEKAHQDFLFKSLLHCPLFQELEHDILRAIVDTMEIEKFEQGDAIYEKNNVGRSGYLLISGAATAETDADDPFTLLRRSSKKEVNIFEGTFFGEHTMLFGFRRRMTVRAIQPTVVGKLKRDVYYNVVTRSAMHERGVREKYLRTGVPMFETFDDELIARIADIMEKRTFKRGEVIVKQGDVGAEFFMILRGQCEASIRVAK